MATSIFDRSCPICSARQAILLRSLCYSLFDDLTLSGAAPLVVCTECGMVFNQLDGGAVTLLDYYRANDHSVFSLTPGSGGLTEIEQRRYQRLFKLLNLEKEHAKIILDFGCGKGGWLEWLNRIGFSHLIGIEASDACRELIKNRASINIYSKITDLPEDTTPQIVSLSHVLEHFYDPLKELKRLVDKTGKDACFFIEVPNSPAMLESSNPWLWLFFEHINHFDEKSLHNLVQRAGLEVIKSGFWPFDPAHGAEFECLYIVCHQATTNNQKNQKISNPSLWSSRLDVTLTRRPLSDSLIESLDPDRPLALWGCSQYAMLVLGMHDELRKRLRILFDVSPAKIGRRIAGIEIHHPSQLQYLGDDYLLLLPRSGYLDSMLKELSDAGLYIDTLVF